MKIQPEVIVTPDRPTVVIREPISEVNLDIEIPKILNAQGWGLGTYFNIQFIKDDRTKLIASGKFIVAEETKAMHTANAESYSPNTREIITKKALQIGDWFYPKGLQQLEDKKVDIVSDGLASAVRWNPGKKVHEVVVGGVVVFADADKDKVLKFRDAA